MRLDKFLASMGKGSRSEISKLIRSGKALVNGVLVKAPDTKINPDTDVITLNSQIVKYKKYVYIMLNKPDGVVSATNDPNEKTVVDLVDTEDKLRGLFPCGRLDKNTLGLIILTNDGDTSHRLLSPKHHVSKVYKFKVEKPLSKSDVLSLEGGVDIGGYFTKPCQVKLYDDLTSGEITLTEGKYHQIKRMAEAINNKITYLERVSFGPIVLDTSLKRGEWRYLSDTEEKLFLEGDKI
ncbi:MAG: rRNA pseudouridine synthase [Clostridia bacterium]|nr:rRNA pseudouridine synthase [Clostridia bacterium]